MNVDSKQFYVTLFSTASQALFPTNTHSAFTVELAQTIDLGSRVRWEVGLCEFACPPPKTGSFRDFTVVGASRAIIYCNLITRQCVCSELVRCLRTFTYPSQYCHHTYSPLYYMPVQIEAIRQIKIEVYSTAGKHVPFVDSKAPTICVLHFRRISEW